MDWKPIKEFPGYSISNMGRVRNDDTDRIMALQRNPHGIVHVGLWKDGKQYKRSVAVLVCEAFLPPPTPPTFDTPIHLDGDKTNCRIDNLMWRPRWFAVRYHRQFHDNRPMGFSGPIRDKRTGEVFRNSMEAAMRFGLLDWDIFKSTIARTYVWPTYQEFREVS